MNKFFNYYKEKEGDWGPTINGGKIVYHAILGLIVLILFFGSWGTVPAGSKGVHLRMNGTTGRVIDPGFYLKLPLIDRVVDMDTRVQKSQVMAEAASLDLQTVDSEIAINYHVNPESVSTIYQTIGTDYADRVLAPALQESVKAVTAKFTAEQLITKREEVRDGIKALLTEKMGTIGVVVDGMNIINFKFSPSFATAIENKVTNEQNALAAKNKLAQVEYEASQRVAAAKGEAEAIKIQAEAIQNQGGAEYVKLQAIGKWNGALPTYMMGDTVPFVSLK